MSSLTTAPVFPLEEYSKYCGHFLLRPHIGHTKKGPQITLINTDLRGESGERMRNERKK
jgi:hypothetical protein